MTRRHRLAAGIDAETTGTPPVLVQGTAALELYRETVALPRPIRTGEQREVADGAAARIRAAGMVRDGSSVPTGETLSAT